MASVPFTLPSPTPREAGFSMPAEWAPQAAIWLSWPLNPVTWPGKLDAMAGYFGQLVAVLSRYQEVRLNCRADAQPAARVAVAAAGADASRVVWYDHPTDDVWCRDHGPTFVKHRTTGEVAVVHWTYNAWGGKYAPWDADADVPRRIAEALGQRRFVIPLVCEGGGLEVNGEGVLLTTESVLLNPNRNPDLSRGEVETALRAGLGVDEIVWLRTGLEGDDTDGHIDTLSRFYAPRGLVTAWEENKADPNHAILAENTAVLEAMRTTTGGRYDVVKLPQPEPIRPTDWRCDRLPATYANFLIVNDAVVVPTYRQPRADDRALGILRELFPDREVVGFDCLEILLEGGAVHCLSQQQPR